MSGMEVSERFPVADHHDKESKSHKRKKKEEKDKRKEKECSHCPDEASVKRKKGLEKESKDKKLREDSPSNPRKKSSKAKSKRATEKSSTGSRDSDMSTNVNEKDGNIEVGERITDELPDWHEEVHNPLHSCWKFKKDEIKTLKKKGTVHNKKYIIISLFIIFIVYNNFSSQSVWMLVGPFHSIYTHPY